VARQPARPWREAQSRGLTRAAKTDTLSLTCGGRASRQGVGAGVRLAHRTRRRELSTNLTRSLRRRYCRRDEWESVAKARVRVLSHRVGWQVEGVVLREYAMTRGLMIGQPLYWHLWRVLSRGNACSISCLPCPSRTRANHHNRTLTLSSPSSSSLARTAPCDNTRRRYESQEPKVLVERNY
jgi:hypothetical protein